MPLGLFENFILPAVTSDDPLPEDPEKRAALQDAVQAFGQPHPVPVPPLPPTALEISDRVYMLEENTLGWTSLALHFDANQPEAILIRNGYHFPLGLDGVYRVTDSPAFPYVQKGAWIRDNVFQIDQELLGWPYLSRILLTFEGNTVRVRFSSGGHSLPFSGTAERIRLLSWSKRAILTARQLTQGESHVSTATNSGTKNTALIGFYTAILTAVLVLITFGIAILTPPVSGSGCVKSCIEYPYLDITSRFPRDYYWMALAIVLTAVYVVLMACLHQYAPAGKKMFSQIALSFGLMAAAVLIVDYFVQLSVIQPSLKNGETEGIALLTQYNPHGIFIALEEIGYLFMALSFMCAAPIFSGTNRVERAIRWVFGLSFPLALLALLGYSIKYGIQRGYRFEIAIISIDWIVLLIAAILLSVVFKRAAKPVS